jgi:transcriptional regulator of acetoin/glycerol metabolism
VESRDRPPQSRIASSFDAGDRAPVIPPRLLASWQRSERYGVSTDEVQPVFTGAMDEGSLFFECGSQVLQGLQATLANEPVSLMLTDSDGLVLTRLCNDSSILRSLDRVHLAPGFSYAERNAGTNGLGLALADRAPSLVRAHEHYCTTLRRYTCAAVPVLDPLTGAIAGSVNLTTWSESSSELLLALAQAAAGNTAALMLARASGRRMRPEPRGRVIRVCDARFAPVDGAGPRLSPRWHDAVGEARIALAKGRIVAVVGEPGAGKATLIAAARRAVRARERILSARPPAAREVDAWLTLWTPELGKNDTCVIVSGVDALPAWAVSELARLFTQLRQHDRPAGAGADRLPPFSLTAGDYSAVPEQLSALIDTVVEAPALRFRPADIMPLARHFARQSRGRPVGFTRAAARALEAYHWPENVTQLRRVVRDAASRADVVDVHHFPAEVFSGTSHPLSRLQVLERDEIVRCLTEPGATAAQAASMLGMSRATVYRKIAQYDIKVPGRTQHNRYSGPP